MEGSLSLSLSRTTLRVDVKMARGERVGWRGGFEQEGGLSGVCGAALVGVEGAGGGRLGLRGIGEARYLTGESA